MFRCKVSPIWHQCHVTGIGPNAHPVRVTARKGHGRSALVLHLLWNAMRHSMKQTSMESMGVLCTRYVIRRVMRRRNELKRRRSTGMSAEWSPAFVSHVVVGNAAALAAELRVRTSAQQLVLPTQGRHIRLGKRDSRAIIAALPAALESLRYRGYRKAKDEPTAVGLCGYGRMPLVGVVFVGARDPSQNDEARITTAHFIGQQALDKKVRNGQLTPILRGR
jgi:hypothetical protein